MSTSKLPRVLFFGTPSFAVPFLRALQARTEVVAVFCQPDKPVGRGRKLQAPPIKEEALSLGLTVYQPTGSLKDERLLDQLHALKPALAFVVAYGRILPAPLLALPRWGCVNAHASLLPRWRGASPIARAIAAGDEETGVCLMQMDEGMDTGPVFATARIPIQPDDTTGSLTERLAVLGAGLTSTHIDDLAHGKLAARPQAMEGVTMAPKLSKTDGHLDLTHDALQLARHVRAMDPWPRAYLVLDVDQGALSVGAEDMVADCPAAATAPEAVKAPVRWTVCAASPVSLSMLDTLDADATKLLFGTRLGPDSSHDLQQGQDRQQAQGITSPIHRSLPPRAFRPGAVFTHRGRLFVRSHDGALELITIQVPGKKAMPAAALLAGYRL